MSRFEELQAKVLNWAENKGILENGTTVGQALKTLEESQELYTHVLLWSQGRTEYEGKDVISEIADGIGDTLVTLIIQAEMQDVDIVDCLEIAYNTIAPRSGKMVDGQFVKNHPETDGM